MNDNFALNEHVQWRQHPEVSGICEGRLVTVNDTNDIAISHYGQILVRVNVKDLDLEKRKLLKNQPAINPRSDISIIYLFNLSDLDTAEGKHGRKKGTSVKRIK